MKAAEVRLAEIEGITKARLPELVRALYVVVGPIDFQRPFDKTPPDALARWRASRLHLGSRSWRATAR